MEQSREAWADELKAKGDSCLNELQDFLVLLERGAGTDVAPILAQIAEFRQIIRDAIDGLSR